jgi:hypothetical protein
LFFGSARERGSLELRLIGSIISHWDGVVLLNRFLPSMMFQNFVEEALTVYFNIISGLEYV